MPTAIIIGGAAAAFFAAITCAEANSGHAVIILEATGEVLVKVRIPVAIRHSPIADRRSPFAIRHSVGRRVVVGG